MELPNVLVEVVSPVTGHLQVQLDGGQGGAEVTLEGVLSVPDLLPDLLYTVEEKVLSQVGGLIYALHLRFSHGWDLREEGAPLAQRVGSPVQH